MLDIECDIAADDAESFAAVMGTLLKAAAVASAIETAQSGDAVIAR